MKYKIMGRHCGETEEIDSADTMREAQYLANEYRIAFGAGWQIFIKRGRA